MTTFVALLRGINVGGKNKVNMAELRAAFIALGHDSVSTYIQSGNVIFSTQGRLTRAEVRALPSVIERQITDVFDIEVPVIVRDGRQLAAIAEDNPFDTESVPATQLAVMFLAAPVSPERVASLDPQRSPGDAFVVRGDEIYLRAPNGFGRSKLTIDYFERRLGTTTTARNWNTVLMLRNLAAG